MVYRGVIYGSVRYWHRGSPKPILRWLAEARSAFTHGGVVGLRGHDVSRGHCHVLRGHFAKCPRNVPVMSLQMSLRCPRAGFGVLARNRTDRALLYRVVTGAGNANIPFTIAAEHH